MLNSWLKCVMLLRASQAHFSCKNAKCVSASGRRSFPDPLPGFCSWTPLGTSVPQNPYTGSPASKARLRSCQNCRSPGTVRLSSHTRQRRELFGGGRTCVLSETKVKAGRVDLAVGDGDVECRKRDWTSNRVCIHFTLGGK